jgi:hypothetical protein
MNLTFLNTKDAIPNHDSQIVFIDCREDSLFESFEFKFGRVEYNWDNNDGCSICYDENDPKPPKINNKENPFELMVLIDGIDFGLFANKKEQNKMNILWAYYDDVFDEINKALI